MIVLPCAKRIASRGSIFCIVLIAFTGCAPSIRYTRDAAQVECAAQHKYSQVLQSEKHIDKISPSDTAGTRLQKIIFPFIGTPYRRGGMSGNGFDCSGFVCLIFKEAFNISLPRSSSQMQYCGTRIHLNSAFEGDLVFFRNYRIGRIGHVGIYMNEGRFVHASTKHGVIYSDLSEPYYKKRFAMVRRIVK
ncbi:MAG TPA: C40 family peptidase [Chitinispirillaceae bacterium]|nr:C40 family peptidase [Chitinispirillaceae bacterium]